MEDLFRIGAFSQRVGMQPTTVRAWERRYGLPVTRRTPGGQRLYDGDCVRQLEQAQALVAQGWSLNRAARRVAHEAAQRREVVELGPEQLVKALLVADERADLAGLQAAAVEAVTGLSRHDLLDAVLAPVLVAGAGRMLDEVLATALATPIAQAEAAGGSVDQLALVAAPAVGRTGAVATLRLALAGSGWRTASLGDGVDAKDLLRVVERTRPGLVALAVSPGDGPGWAEVAAALLGSDRLGDTEVVVAGAPRPAGTSRVEARVHRGLLHRLGARA